MLLKGCLGSGLSKDVAREFCYVVRPLFKVSSAERRLVGAMQMGVSETIVTQIILLYPI